MLFFAKPLSVETWFFTDIFRFLPRNSFDCRNRIFFSEQFHFFVSFQHPNDSLTSRSLFCRHVAASHSEGSCNMRKILKLTDQFRMRNGVCSWPKKFFAYDMNVPQRTNVPFPLVDFGVFQLNEERSDEFLIKFLELVDNNIDLSKLKCAVITATPESSQMVTDVL